MTSALTLAERLAALPDEQLGAVVRAHSLATSRGRGPSIDDFFDLAEAMLEPHAVRRALMPLPRDVLAVLGALDTASDEAEVRRDLASDGATGAALDGVPASLDALVGAFLAERSGAGHRPYLEVGAGFSAWLDESGLTRRDLSAPAPAEEPAGGDDVSLVDRVAAEHAFAAVGAVTELVHQLHLEPARRLQKGGLALPDLRRLSAALGVDQPLVAIALWFAEATELIAVEGALWLPTDAAADWPATATARRWERLAEAWLASVPPDIRPIMAERAGAAWGDALRGRARWRYPAADGSLDALVLQLGARAEFLGVTASLIPGSAGRALVEDGPAAACALVTDALPAEVEQVYVQHDLSIVAPGPLAPALAARLRVVADAEGTGLAASFRVSPASLHRAIAAGESAASVRAFLEEISLTRVPQPLAYLIEEAQRHYGRVRVRADRAGTLVVSAEPQLIATMSVDQGLAALGLQHADGGLRSRFPLETAYWALIDARYPAIAEDASGGPMRVRRRVVHAAHVTEPDRAGELVARLRAAERASGAAGAEAWLRRQLESAVRSRSTVRVTVALPDGAEHDYTLEPTGMSGGRLRGRDRDRDIERTLPVTSIRSVTMVP